jgi:hypothetical protein
MGRGVRAGKVTKNNHKVRTVWKDTERSVKREQLDIIAGICDTKREVIGSVISNATLTDAYNDDGAAERASDTGTSTATV